MMSEKILYIRKIDNVHLKVTSNSNHTEEQLFDYFSFRPKNYRFTPKYKHGLWDGYIRLYNPYNNYLPLGLKKDVIKFAKIKNCRVKIDKNVFSKNDITISDIENYIHKELKPTNEYGDYLTTRDYQLYAIYKSIREKRLILKASTNSGKSLIAYSILRYLLDHDKITSGLIIVPTLNLVHQMFGDFGDYSMKDDDFNHEEWIHKIYADQDKYSDKPIYISTWQSIYKFDSEYFSQFDCIIGDEVHGYEAPSLVKIMQETKNCEYKIGMSGSIVDEISSTMTLKGLFGEIEDIISTKEMIDRGYSTLLNITGIQLNYGSEIIQQLKNILKEKKNNKHEQKLKPIEKYKIEIDFLTNLKIRNKFIVKLALSLKGNSLILHKNIEHGKVLKKIIEKNSDRKVFIVNGSVKGDKREKIRKEIEKLDNCIVIATFQTFSTGINIKNLHNLIFASPLSSEKTLKQSLGRLLRKHESKDLSNIYDIYDILYKGNYSQKQFIERVNIYRKEKHKYKIKKYTLGETTKKLL